MARRRKEDEVPKLKDLSEYWILNREKVPTGIYALDILCGGGTENGDLIEFASESGVGKSTTLLNVCRNRLKLGRRQAYLDIETGVKAGTVQSVGLPQPTTKVGDPFLMASPATFEELDEVMQSILNVDDPYQDIYIDSITAVIPAVFQNIPMGECNKRIGEKARYQAFFLEKYKPLLRWKGANLWMVSQTRVKINLQGVSTLESAGGQACRFYPDVRFMAAKGPVIKREESVMGGKPEEVIYGNLAHIWCEKNRGERSHIRLQMPIIFGRGVSNILFLRGAMQESKIITGGQGGHYKVTWKEEASPYGGEALNAYIKANITEIYTWMQEQGMLKLVQEVSSQ